jgi:hypothetical protein
LCNDAKNRSIGISSDLIPKKVWRTGKPSNLATVPFSVSSAKCCGSGAKLHDRIAFPLIFRKKLSTGAMMHEEIIGFK